MGFKLSPTSAAGKWMGFVTAVWVQAISGNNYTFSNYSDALKSLMALTQLQLNNLSVAKDVGKAFGILAGLASDRISPSALLLIDSIEGFIGYGVQWLVVSQKIQPLPYWQMCIFLCLGGNSATWMNTAILVTCIRNFRKNRGPVSGILKGYVGLSTAIFTDIGTALFNNDPARFLLMLATVPVVICFFAIVFLREIPPSSTVAEEKSKSRDFAIFNALAVIIAVYLLIFDITGEHGRALSQAFCILLIILLATPLAVPVYLAIQNLIRSDLKTIDVEATTTDATEPLLIIQQEEQSNETEAVTVMGGEKEAPAVVEKMLPVIGEEHTVFEALKTVDFWILFISFLCGVGTGLAVQNNMGQMGLALGYADVSIFVSLTSIWGFFGRIGSGSVSEYFINCVQASRANVKMASFSVERESAGIERGMKVTCHAASFPVDRVSDMDRRKLMNLLLFGVVGLPAAAAMLVPAADFFPKLWKAGTPRSLWNAASQILMAVGYVLMAIAMPGSLYIGSIVVGICYGARLAITVPTASELFGLKYYGLIYNILILNLPLGSFLFSGLLAGFLYYHEATATTGGGNTCIGAHCYRNVFIVMTAACVVGFVLDVWLAIRTKGLYSRIYTSRKAKKSMAASNSQ